MRCGRVELVLWDWKDEVEGQHLTGAVKRGCRFFYNVQDTGGDEFALVCSSFNLTSSQVQEFYDVLSCTDSFECTGHTVALALEDAHEEEEATLARDAEDDASNAKAKDR